MNMDAAPAGMSFDSQMNRMYNVGMAGLLENSVVCPVLIGRTSAIASLDGAIISTRNAQGQAIVLAGEAGIGKSRLVAETKVRAAQMGFSILEGKCFEPDRALPYAPLIDLLRAFCLARSPEEIGRDLDSSASELAKLLPELATLLPDLVITSPLEPEQEKRRLFQTLAQLFARLAASYPLLVVVEDLQWSDDTSFEFLLHLGRRLAVQPILLLLSYRSDETLPVLMHFLAELDRERLAHELTLARLAPNEVEAMLRAIFDLAQPVRAEFLEAIYSLTEGNPFFIEEVLKSLIAAGDIYYAEGAWDRKPMDELRIPRSVQDAVRRRLAQLSDGARRMLILAAVAGRRFDFTLLQNLTQGDEGQMLQWIKEAIAAQLVVEESAEQFAFRHTLTRQTIYSDLLARERKVLHHTIGEAMERLYAGSLESHLADLAYHFGEAQVWVKALEYSQRAGEKAQSLYAPRAAVEHFTHALEAARQLSSTPSPKLYRARGQAYEILGDFQAAHNDHATLLQIAGATGDLHAEWQALLDLGFLWASRDYAQSGDYFQRALELARTMGDPSTLARSLNRVGNWHLNVEQPLQAQQAHHEALAIVESLNDRRGIAETLDLLGMASFIGGDLRQGQAHWEQAITLFRELGDRQGLVSSQASLPMCGETYQTSTLISNPMDPAAVVRESEAALKIAREIGWRSAEAYTLFTLGFYLGPKGDYARAFACLQASLEIATEIEHRQWMVAAQLGLGALYLDLLDLPKARVHLELALALAQQIGSLHWIRNAVGFLASTYIAQQELAEAESLLNIALGPDTPAQTIGQRLAWHARAELALARDEPVLALQIVDRLIASAANAAKCTGECIIPRLSKLRGEALAALGRADEAEAALMAVAQATQALVWRLHLALAQVYHGQLRHPEAKREASVAQAAIEGLAANVPDEGLREGFRRSAIALIPPPLLAPRMRPSTPRQAAKQKFGGLTAREREVATLIAQGKSNREIADSLVVGKRTVETHVANILSKLGFASRAQIAAWAEKKGLTPEEEC